MDRLSVSTTITLDGVRIKSCPNGEYLQVSFGDIECGSEVVLEIHKVDVEEIVEAGQDFLEGESSKLPVFMTAALDGLEFESLVDLRNSIIETPKKLIRLLEKKIEERFVEYTKYGLCPSCDELLSVCRCGMIEEKGYSQFLK